MSALTHFDAESAWIALSENEKAEVGRTALILACSLVGQEDDDPYETPVSRASSIAFTEAANKLVEAFELCSPDAAINAPNLNQIGIRSCTSCGCTDDHGCGGGCRWVGPTLCSSCEGAVQRASVYG